MGAVEIIVTVAGALLIPWILWYFFWSEGPRVRATGEAGGVQEVHVRVQGGYDPDLIVVEAGRPVRLEFYRNETADCSEELVFGDFGVRKTLPAFETTAVEFTPERPGEYVFTCGMAMMRGRLIVEPSGAGGPADGTGTGAAYAARD